MINASKARCIPGDLLEVLSKSEKVLRLRDGSPQVMAKSSRFLDQIRTLCCLGEMLTSSVKGVIALYSLVDPRFKKATSKQQTMCGLRFDPHQAQYRSCTHPHDIRGRVRGLNSQQSTELASLRERRSSHLAFSCPFIRFLLPVSHN